jgi:hypothetical protein
MPAEVRVRPVVTPADRRAFVDLAWQVYRDDPAWVPPLKSEVHGLLDPKKNPWFGHGRAQLWLAERDGRAIGRISAQVDDLVQAHMAPGTGQWGMFEALDAAAASALIAAAEDWLRGRGMTRALGPISISIWDEPGLEIDGFDEPPTVMMGHHRPEYRGWIEAAGYSKAKDLLTYEVDIANWADPLADRLVAAGTRNPRIRIRKVDKKRFDSEARVMPWARSQSSAVAISAAAASPSSASNMPHWPVPPPICASTSASTCALIRPTTSSPRSASHSCALACSNHGFLAGVMRPWTSSFSGGTQAGSSR